MTQFKARLSPFVLGYTIVIFAGLAGVGGFNLVWGETEVAVPVLCIAAGFLIIGLWCVRGYDVGDGQLVIHRAVWDTRVDLAGLVEAEADPKLVRSSVSVWSTRGLFGFIGYGYSSRVGTYRAYVTKPKNAVLLRFSSGKIVVVSPESPGEFVQAVLAQSCSPHPASLSPPGPPVG